MTKGLTLFLAAILFLSLGSVAAHAASGIFLPTADGVYQQWIPNNFMFPNVHAWRVDEASCNGNTDYVYATVPGQRDSYRFDLSSIPNGSTITGVTAIPCASMHPINSSLPFGVLWLSYSWSGVRNASGYLGPTYNLSNATPAPQAPATLTGLSWEKQEDSTLEIIAEAGVVTSTTSGVRLSQLAVNITYTPPPAPVATNPPANLRVSYPHLNDGSALLRWDDHSTDEFGFVVERSADGVNYTNIATVTANTTSYIDHTVDTYVPSGWHYYRVRGYRMFPLVNSAYTNVVSIFLGSGE